MTTELVRIRYDVACALRETLRVDSENERSVRLKLHSDSDRLFKIEEASLAIEVSVACVRN